MPHFFVQAPNTGGSWTPSMARSTALQWCLLEFCIVTMMLFSWCTSCLFMQLPSSSQRWQWRILQIWMNFPLKPPFTGGFPIAMFDDQRVPLKTMLLIVWPDGDGKNVMALGIFHLACAHEEHCGFSRLHGCFAWKPMKKNVCEKDPDVPTNFHVLGKRLCLSGRSIFTAYWLLMNQNIILYHAYWLGTHISSAPYRLFHPEMAPRHEEWGGAPKLPNSNKTFEFPNGCAMLKEAHSRLLGIVPSPQYETPWNTL